MKESVINSREGQETVLTNLKTKFEKVVKEIETSKGKLEHQNIESVFINLGTYFLVADIQSLNYELEEAQKNNKSNVLKIKERIIETEHQTDYPEKKRALILLRFYPDIPENMFEFATLRLKQKQAMFNSFISFYESQNEKIGYNTKMSIDQTLEKMESQFDKFIGTDTTV